MYNIINALQKGLLVGGAVTLIIGAGGIRNYRTEAVYMIITGVLMLSVSCLLLLWESRRKP